MIGGTTEVNLTSVLGWGYLDIKALESWAEDCRAWGVDIDDIAEEIENECPEMLNEINEWFYMAMSRLLGEITSCLHEHGLDELADWLSENNDTHVNYMCSMFDGNLCQYNLKEEAQDIDNFFGKLMADYVAEELGINSRRDVLECLDEAKQIDRRAVKLWLDVAFDWGVPFVEIVYNTEDITDSEAWLESILNGLVDKMHSVMLNNDYRVASEILDDEEQTVVNGIQSELFGLSIQIMTKIGIDDMIKHLKQRYEVSNE